MYVDCAFGCNNVERLMFIMMEGWDDALENYEFFWKETPLLALVVQLPISTYMWRKTDGMIM